MKDKDAPNSGRGAMASSRVLGDGQEKAAGAKNQRPKQTEDNNDDETEDDTSSEFRNWKEDGRAARG
jgi:hypothetical protein